MAKMSKRKIRRLRKQGSVKAPQPKLGFGRLHHSGAGVHACKKRKAKRKLEALALRDW